VEEVRAQVARINGQMNNVPTGQIPFTPGVKRVFEGALREALSLSRDYIATEHILLGLVREDEGVAGGILLDFDANAEKIRSEVSRLANPRTPTPDTPPLAQLRIVCPNCGDRISLRTGLEPESFEAHVQGERTCPTCKTTWIIDYNVRMKRDAANPDS
jgi:ATP-dependent Clp protease ATP-binding subunit ClpA